ncbi:MULTISPECIES: DUF1090 domain-containing protein [Vibrio]|uniref:DUF1090 domain-containing protein n=1 Tax=Vibrio cortegadensis TaxID=1328770 RepID=A0ABV4M4X7_9VIBR|nr:DUF1090 domain-containing protein [Vibrio cortegadensis]MDN3696158.1 DUF1090 domain-containing protein [Vibrio cortegadensis]RBW65879.1 DUF1090 domain-containing protein [Vibrionales bacterium C3R12]
MLRNNIKLLLSIFFFLPISAFASDCSEKIGCDKKACIIQAKMDIAKLNGHDNKLAGLKNALDHVNDYCTNDDLKDELLEKLQDSESDLREYRSELEEAHSYEEEDKILKYQRKIEEEQREIKVIERELSFLK